MGLDYSRCGFSPASAGRIVAVFESYLDESIEGSLLTVAGFVAEVDSWAKFSHSWASTLRTHRVEYFHSKTFRNQQSKHYKHLASFERKTLISSLVKTIRETATFGAALSVDVNLFMRLTDSQLRSRHGSAYSFCVSSLVTSLMGRYLTDQGTRVAHSSVFLENGHKNAVQAIERLRRYKQLSDEKDTSDWGNVVGHAYEIGDRTLQLDTIGLGDKKTMLPLQAADILAYCSTALATNPRHEWAFPVATAIGSVIPIYGAVVNESIILGWAEAMKEWDEQDRALKVARHIQRKKLSEMGIPFSGNAHLIRFQVPSDISKEDLEQLNSVFDADLKTAKMVTE